MSLLSLSYRLADWSQKLISRFKRRPQTLASELVTPVPSGQDLKRIVHGKIDKIINIHYNNTDKAVVITPTTGSECLQKAIESVASQNYKDVQHWIVIDGACYEREAKNIIAKTTTEKIKILTLPMNTGQHGFNGHRIYAALPYLISSKYIFFLDQDNWYDSDHVGSLVELIETQHLDWAFSLRKIFDHQNEFVVDDNCESLGIYPSYSNRPNFVDTNCYALKRSALTQVAHAWYHPLGADRHFYKHLSAAFPNYRTSGQYTVNYKLTENRSPSPEFFIDGNLFMTQKYKGVFPWSIKSKAIV